MRFNYYKLNNFDIKHLKDGWFFIDCKPLGHYLFNIDSVEIAKIPIGISKSKQLELVEKTLKEKIIIPSKIYNPENFFNNKKVPRLMIFPTATCNLSCIYCHCSSDRTVSHMDDSILHDSIIKYINYVERNSGFAQVLEITFMGGGEPFIRFDRIRNVVSYIKSKRIKAKYTIVTNGTLGTDDDWKWLLSEKFRITISADGPPEVQNYQRPYSSNLETSPILEKRLNFLTTEKAKINIRSTIIDSSKNNIEKICNYFRMFKCVKTHQLEPVSFAGRGLSLSEDNLLTFYESYFEHYSKYLYSSPSRYKSAWFKPFQKSDGFCGAVYHNAIITHDGYVSLCTEVDSKSLKNRLGNEFIVSHINESNPFESSKAIAFTNKHSITEMEYCKLCIIRYKCGGGCYVKRYRDFPNDLSLFYKSFCNNIISLQLSYLLQIYDYQLKSKNPTTQNSA
ncbi:MAG: radical SAM protein [Bacteroidales bacterium]